MRMQSVCGTMVGLVAAVGLLVMPGRGEAQQCGASEATYPPRAPELTLLVGHNTLQNHSVWVKNSAKHVLSEYLTPGTCPVAGGGNGPSCSPGTDHCGAEQVCASGYHPWTTCPEDAGPIEQDDRPANGSREDPEEGPSLANDSEDTGEQGPCYCWEDGASQASCATGADCGAYQRCVEGKCRCRDFDWSGCDPIRFGLTVFDEASCGANTDEATNHMVAEMEEEEVGRGADVIEELDRIKGSQGGAEAFCRSSSTYRPLDEALLEHQRDEKFPRDPQVEERMWGRAHVNLLYVSEMPQTGAGRPDSRVSKSLDAVCKMLEGDDGRGSGAVPPLVTHVVHFAGPGGCVVGDEPVDVFAGMLAAAGATGSCCYDANADGDCDDARDRSSAEIGDPAGFCRHVRGLDESELRARIATVNDAAGHYRCDYSRRPGDVGSIPFCRKPGLDCQLAGADNAGGTNCRNPSIAGDTDVLASIGCIRALPKGRDFSEVAYEVCPDGGGSCRRVRREEVEFLDPNERVFRIARSVTVDGESVCSGQFAGRIRQNPCPDEGKLCTTPTGCAAGVIKCVDNSEVCLLPDQPVDREEVCDGRDNDCDGRVDEEVTERCDTGREGRCSVGVRRCHSGSFGACEVQNRAVPEICNGLDDDCNGVADDIRASLQKPWMRSRGALLASVGPRMCAGRSRCVCPGSDAADTAYRSSRAAGDRRAEFDAMVEQTETGCYCESD